jgi:serine protease Do
MYAGTYPVVDRDGRIESPFVAVVEQVQDAVVNISARSRGESVPWWAQSGNTTSSGSGFFFREDGYILTNNHVIEDAVKLTVRTSSGYTYEAKLVGADPRTDLAVLKVEPEEPVTVISFGDSDDLKVGDWALAIGNPFPEQGLDRTVTVGVISALGRSNLHFGQETPAYQSYIQTDASINPGNSGGPLLNLRGECVGVNAAISSPTGGSVGIGFAIPINMARAIVPDLISTGRAQRGWLGVWFHEVTQREAKRYGLDAVRGVVTDSVFSNSPAQQAGLRKGDIITGYDGHEVDNAGRLSVLVSTTRSDDPIPIKILRDGKELTLKALVVDRDAFLASVNPGEGSFDNSDESAVWMGMELITFTQQIARATSVKFIDGIYVGRVYSGSPADYASLTRGSIILQVGDEAVGSIEELEEIVAALGKRPGRIPLIVQEPDGSIARKVIRPQR